MAHKKSIELLMQHSKYLKVLFNGNCCESIPNNVEFEVYRRDKNIYLQFGDSITEDGLYKAIDQVRSLEEQIDTEQEYEKGNPSLIKALKVYFECPSKR